MKLQFSIEQSKNFLSNTNHDNPFLRLLSPLNNFNILPLQFSNRIAIAQFPPSSYSTPRYIKKENPRPTFLKNFTYHFSTFNHSTFFYSLFISKQLHDHFISNLHIQYFSHYFTTFQSLLLLPDISRLLSKPFEPFTFPPSRKYEVQIHEYISVNNHEQLTGPVFHFQALVYRDGNLVSGSLEALVQHMVPTEEYYPDRAYLFAFLLSARLFIKPHELLGEVCALCEHQQNLNGEGGKVRPHGSSSLVLHKSPTRAFRACTLRPPRALSFHRLEAASRPPFRIHPSENQLWHARSRSAL